jgi:hypothetical protein
MERGNVDKATTGQNIDIDRNGSVLVATTQLLIHLPDGLLRGFKRHVSVQQRSRFIQRLLGDALPPEDRDDDPLYQAASAVEEDETLAAEMTEWEAATIADGLGDSEPKETPVRERYGARRRRNYGSARRYLVGEPGSNSR